MREKENMTVQEALDLLDMMQTKYNIETYEDIANMIIALKNMLCAIQRVDTMQHDVEIVNLETAIELLKLTANVVFQCDIYFRQ